MKSAGSGIGLAQAIELVRQELDAAAQAGAGARLGFVPDAVELEFEVVFETTGGAEAEVKVWVVSLGGKGEVSHEQTQRIKVALRPFDRLTRRPAEIGDSGDD
jgi:hypothetical protein